MQIIDKVQYLISIFNLDWNEVKHIASYFNQGRLKMNVIWMNPIELNQISDWSLSLSPLISMHPVLSDLLKPFVK